MSTSQPPFNYRNTSAQIGWSNNAIWALCLFFLANLALSLYAFAPTGRLTEERGATFQACNSAVDQFNKSIDTPSIVLMGSSLVMAPVWSLDNTNFSGVADVYHHHRALQLQQTLATSGKEQDVFSFALPGAMMSDFYLIAEKLFTDTHTPKLLVCGLAPRDFMDDLLTGETRTAVFQRLMTLQDLPHLGSIYLSSFQEKTDFILNHLFYLYGKRWRYQDKIAYLLRRMYNQLLSPAVASAHTVSNQLEQQFMLNEHRAQVWAKSIEEYRARYRHFNQAQFEKQSCFLKALLALGQKRGIQIVLVNMPLTQENIELMPEGLYKRYLTSIADLAIQYQCQLIDLQKDGYRDSDFYDTVHLNAQGGRRFVSHLASWIAKESTIAQRSLNN